MKLKDFIEVVNRKSISYIGLTCNGRETIVPIQDIDSIDPKLYDLEISEISFETIDYDDWIDVTILLK